jgi:hypothetical protein
VRGVRRGRSARMSPGVINRSACDYGRRRNRVALCGSESAQASRS